MNKSSQVEAALKVTIEIARAIRELKRVPSGHLYARLMGVMNLDQYEKVIGILVKQNLIQKTAGHELVWIGN